MRRPRIHRRASPCLRAAVARARRLLAGMFADGIFFAGMTLPQYKVDLVAVLILVVFFVVGPLMVFMPVLARAKRAGLREYGMFAQRYVQAFDRKWLRGKRADDEQLG